MNHTCPDCRVGGLLHGPHGGCSINVKCNNPECRHEFSIAVVNRLAMMGERLDQDEPAVYRNDLLWDASEFSDFYVVPEPPRFYAPPNDMFWLLDETGNNPVAVDMETWVRGIHEFHGDRRSKLKVKQETLGRSWISTVFLTVGWGPPKWETMVFGGKLDGWQKQCEGNREQAEAMHRAALARVVKAEGFRVWLFPFLDDQIYDWRDWFAIFLSIKEITLAITRWVRSGLSQSLEVR